MFASYRVTKLVGVLGIVAMFGMAGSASAEVALTKHNLSLATGAFSTVDGDLGSTEVCIYCHTPHNALAIGSPPPLWNRALTTQTFTLHTDPVTLVEGVLGMGSIACLGCHDGTIGLNEFGGSTQSTQTLMTGTATFDADLTNQHPVGITYPVLDTANFITDPAGAEISAAGKVECNSCHSPHGTANVKFLLVDNAASALCLSCHLK